jgi:large subunit ribosomal protein L4e
MCRGGRMFCPNKIWRRWHVRINRNQRRYATVSALAASAVAPLVMARGHRIEKIAEVPLVVADVELDGIAKTKDAVKLLKSVGAFADIQRVKDSRHIRPGKGKARNRRHVQKRGPLIIHNKSSEGDRLCPQLISAFRNIPGVDFCHVSRLNLLQLAPGGHIGRFIVWTEGAFKQLDTIFGTSTTNSVQKKHYRPPRSILTNADINRVINSQEIQSAIRPRRVGRRLSTTKKNPLKNLGAMFRLNPYAKEQRNRALGQQKAAEKRKKAGKKEEKKPQVKGGVKKPKVKKSKKMGKFLQVLNTPSVAPARSELEKQTHH